MSLPASHALPVTTFNRHIAIGGGVVLLHIAAIWALQTGMLRRAVEVVVPVTILSEMVAPPAPPPPAPDPPSLPEPVKPTVVKKVEPVRPPAPRPMAVPSPAPEPQAPTGVEVAMPPAPPVAAPVAVAPPSPPAPPAPPKVDLPSSAADYLQNPAPVYPPVSKRLGEQGKVLVRVFIGADGLPQKAELKRSSGFDRLDRSALDYVMRCRYVPGKVGGVAQAMWYEAPVNFVLE
jgi:protein TonB